MSLRIRILLWQLLSLLVLLAISCIFISWLANKLSGQIYDEHLLNSADSIIGRIENDKQKIDVDLPVEARDTLRHQDRDNFYYQIIRSNGKIIECDEYIPPSFARRARLKKPVYYESIVDGNNVRVLEICMVYAADPRGFLYVDVAETLNTRKAFARKIFLAFLLVLILFILCSVLSMWIGLGRGLLPLKTMQDSLGERSPSDLQPISLYDAPQEVISLVKTINVLFRQVSKHVQAQARFAANAAHQLRTPLSGIKTYIDLGMRYAPEPKMQEILQQIDQGILRLVSLIEKILLLARCEPALIANRIDSLVDLNAIVIEVISEVSPIAEKKKVKLNFSPSFYPIRIPGDSVTLHELTKNILENAIAYSEPVSDVYVSIEVGERVSLMIEDSGSGIPIVERERVFEPFYRLSSNNVAGIGLGLAIARDIAKAHRAEIVLEDNNDSIGTRAIVKFPLLSR